MTLVSIERGNRGSEVQRRIVSMTSLVLGSALAFFFWRLWQQLGLRAVQNTSPFPPGADQPRAGPQSALESSPVDRFYTCEVG